MEFRPCIDVHNGKVKQIVGGSLSDVKDFAKENFVSEFSSKYYSDIYYELGFKGGHVIMLNPKSSPFYNSTKQEAISALKAHPGFLQIGGGISAENASEFICEGASHVIVTSYVFNNGQINFDNLKKLVNAVGKKHIVLDLSCKKTPEGYKIVTDRWQKISDTIINRDLLSKLSSSCDEFLIHAVDVEGKCNGVETDLIEMLADFNGPAITYAGGVSSLKDLVLLKQAGKDNVNVTVGSALEIFGGTLKLSDIKKICK